MVLAGTAAELIASSVKLLDDALHLPPAQLGQEVDEAEREIARLRDALIRSRVSLPVRQYVSCT
jgi:hypothetical protein